MSHAILQRTLRTCCRAAPTEENSDRQAFEKSTTLHVSTTKRRSPQLMRTQRFLARKLFLAKIPVSFRQLAHKTHPSFCAHMFQFCNKRPNQDATRRGRRSDRLNSVAVSPASNIDLKSPFQTSQKLSVARDAPIKLHITSKDSSVSVRVKPQMADPAQRRYLQHRAPDCGRDLRMFLEAPSTSPEARQRVSPRSPSSSERLAIEPLRAVPS